MIHIHDIEVVLKGIVAFTIAWFTDNVIVWVASLAFVSPPVRDFFIETKDIVNWFVSVTIFITVIYKLYKEHNKK